MGAATLLYDVTGYGGYGGTLTDVTAVDTCNWPSAVVASLALTMPPLLTGCDTSGPGSLVLPGPWDEAPVSAPLSLAAPHVGRTPPDGVPCVSWNWMSDTTASAVTVTGVGRSHSSHAMSIGGGEAPPEVVVASIMPAPPGYRPETWVCGGVNDVTWVPSDSVLLTVMATCDGAEVDAFISEASAGDSASACFGVKAFADGAAWEGCLEADELTAIGELPLADKMAGLVAAGVLTNIMGMSWAEVIKAGVDSVSV